MRSVALWTAAFSAAALGAALGGTDTPGISLSIRTTQGVRPVPLTDPRGLVTSIERLFGSCSFDSLDRSERETFSNLLPLDETWKRYANAPHLHVRIVPALPVLARDDRKVSISEVLIPIGSQGGPDYWFTRDGESIVVYTKCGCESSTAVTCAPELKAHLPPDALKYCTTMEDLRSKAEATPAPSHRRANSPVVHLLAVALLAAPPLEIEAVHETPAEQQTIAQLRGLLERYDVSPWLYTRRIRIDGRAIPHSHPVLTLHTRHLRQDTLLLSTFVHEQLHWFLESRPEAASTAVADLETLFPEVPVGFPEGADTRRSTYEHLLVTCLERQLLARLVGKKEASRAMEFWEKDHYRWIYRTMRERHKDIRRILKRRGLEPAKK